MAELRVLADRIHRLSPSHRHPEQWHADKDEIAHALRCIAQRMEAA